MIPFARLISTMPDGGCDPGHQTRDRPQGQFTVIAPKSSLSLDPELSEEKDENQTSKSLRPHDMYMHFKVC
jgi:hypothetical protein